MNGLSHNLIHITSRRRGVLVVLAACSLCVLAAGCNVAGYAAQVFDKPVKKKAEYRGLENKSVAVIVAVADSVRYRYPNATAWTMQRVASKLKTGVPGITVVNPTDMLAFQVKNPGFEAVPYGQLVQRLRVDRLVYVDVSEYSTHEPGNAEVWRGEMVANVHVIEAGSRDPSNPTHSWTVSAEFPEGGTIGLVNSDDQTIQAGMLEHFSRRAAWLFHDYEVPPK